MCGRVGWVQSGVDDTGLSLGYIQQYVKGLNTVRMGMMYLMSLMGM